jgi:sarcosine oxidase
MGVERRDVVVVGGGVMGSASAWQLARAGRAVTLLERFEPDHVQGASHGSSRIFRLGYAHPAYIDLARRAQGYWRELEAATETDLLTITGGIEHGVSPYLPALDQALTAAGLADSRWLAAAEAEERWPVFRFEGPVFYQPYTGRLHADHAVKALQDNAIALGAEVQWGTPALTVVPLRDDLVEVRTEDTTYQASSVIVTAGAWTRKLLDDQLKLPTLRVTQEQPVHFAARDPESQWPAFGHLVATNESAPETFLGGIYGLAAPGDGIKVGFHGVGPEVDPDGRDFRSEPGQLPALQDYARHVSPFWGCGPRTCGQVSGVGWGMHNGEDDGTLYHCLRLRLDAVRPRRMRGWPGRVPPCRSEPGGQSGIQWSDCRPDGPQIVRKKPGNSGRRCESLRLHLGRSRPIYGLLPQPGGESASPS